MKRKLFNSSRRYQDALRTQMKQGKQAGLAAARSMGWPGAGRRAANAGSGQAPRADARHRVVARRPGRQTRRAHQAGGKFFCRGDHCRSEKPHAGTQEAAVHLRKIIETLSQRTVELAASNLELSQEIAQRKAAEAALKKSEHHYSELLEQSDHLQEQLRQLSRQILSAQEEERREISRELHDVIAQTLTGINVRLAALAKEAATNTKGLDRNIARTQRLVEKSVDIVHRFARELRPAVLDDLGLIPALHSFMKIFTTRTGVRTHLKAFAGMEQLETARRTVLFRVAQEALTNVARHAKASRVEVSIQKLAGRHLHENKGRWQIVSGGTHCCTRMAANVSACSA